MFVTAFSSLAYELVWTRKLSYVFGSTALAASSVLSVFMAGLGLGSWLAGRHLRRAKRPLRVYAALEIAAGEVLGAATSGKSHMSGGSVTPALSFGRLLGRDILRV